VIEKISDRIAQVLLVVAATLAFLLCFLVCADVIGRVGFNRPVKGTPEMVSFTIVIVCFLQAAYAIRSGGMIRVEAVIELLPPWAQRSCMLFGALAGFAFFGLVFWGSLDPLAHAWSSNEFEGEGALRVPVWPARFIVALGTLLAAFNYLLLALRDFRALLARPLKV
jgi:TRAP-type C4-dicarboxylate transport system permease small subunit